jgi:hypothetical protein
MPVIVTVHTVFHSRYILIALLLGAGASASAGDRIVFSNRGGQRVVFEFDQKEILLPADLRRETTDRVNANLIPAHFKVTTARVTPNDVQRRSAAQRNNPGRDWIFQDPKGASAKAGKSKSKSAGVPEIFQPEQTRESALFTYLKGEEAGPDGETQNAENAQTEEKKRSEASGYKSKYDSRQALTYEISRIGNKSGSWLQQLEMNTGAGRELNSAFANSRTRIDSAARQERHQASMTAFKQMLHNPFQKSSFGTSSLVGGGGLSSAPAVGVSLGGGTLAPTRANINFQKQGSTPSAFNNSESAFAPKPQETFQPKAPRRLEKASFELEIPKRRFR